MSDRHQPRPQVPGHRVETVIGRGASSTVWQGRDAMGDAVAIKVPHEVGWLADEQAARTEQHVLMAVRHEHLVGLRDVVAMPDDRTALVFDLVTGASLRGMVRSRGHLRPGEVVTVVTPLCEAVAALHSAGGLHGDISPSNVMVTAEGKPLLLDLGAARLAGSPADTPVFGTPGFVAPEVRQGLPPTEASDVFSLGAVVWFCLTGNGAPDTMLRLDPEVVRSHVGAEVAEVVGACIDPDPQRRPASASLARLFFEAAPAEPVEVVVDADEASALTHRIRAAAREEDPVTEAWHEHDSRGRWWTRWRWTVRGRPTRAAAVVAGLAALLAVALGVGAVASRSAAVAPDDAVTTGSPAAGRPSADTDVRPSGATTAVATPSADRDVRPSGATTAVTTPSADADVLLGSLDAPRTAPREVLQALSDRRAEALATRDPARLSRVDEPSSPAWAADAAVIGRLRTEGTRWEGLSLEVARAAPVTVTSARTVIRARVDWTAYAVVGAGERVTEPAETGDVLDFTLVRTDLGWRIAAISAPAS